jgi:predicted kinase
MPFVSATGLKGVNSDQAFEALLGKFGLSKDLRNLTSKQKLKTAQVRQLAKRTTNIRMQQFINSRLGMLIDGTGKNYTKIAKMKIDLQRQGYDCYMVFVNTDLDVALERNANRERKIPEDIVKKSWKEVNQNLGRFQTLFGAGNMLVVDNSEYKQFGNIVKKKAREFVRRPIQNHIAKKWIKQELEMRKS